MSEAVRSWLLSMVATALIVSVLEMLTPDGLPKRVGHLLGGLLLLLVLVRPVSSLGLENLGEYFANSALFDAQWDQSLEETDQALLESLITDSCQAYIEAQAAQLGASCQVTVTCRWEEDIPIPDSVTIIGELTEEQQQSLRQEIAADFDIPAERQTFQSQEVS